MSIKYKVDGFFFFPLLSLYLKYTGLPTVRKLSCGLLLLLFFLLYGPCRRRENIVVEWMGWRIWRWRIRGWRITNTNLSLTSVDVGWIHSMIHSFRSIASIFIQHLFFILLLWRKQYNRPAPLRSPPIIYIYRLLKAPDFHIARASFFLYCNPTRITVENYWKNSYITCTILGLGKNSEEPISS